MVIAQSTRPKYGNHRVQHGTHAHDSQAELRHCEELEIRLRVGEITSFFVHTVWPLHGKDGSLICRFIPDFMVVVSPGDIHMEDVKGHIDKKSPAWNLFQVKCKLLTAEYGIPVRVVT